MNEGQSPVSDLENVEVFSLRTANQTLPKLVPAFELSIMVSVLFDLFDFRRFWPASLGENLSGASN